MRHVYAQVGLAMVWLGQEDDFTAHLIDHLNHLYEADVRRVSGDRAPGSSTGIQPGVKLKSLE